MSPLTVRHQTVLILGAGLIAISFASIFIKLCDAPSLVIAAYRLTIASVFYLGFTRIKDGAFIWKRFSKSQIYIIIIAALFLTLHFSAWISSLKLTSVASSVVLVQSSPIFVAIGGMIILKERPSLLVIAGVVIALTGSVIISIHDFSIDKNSLSGNLLAVAGAVGAAGYLLAGRKLRAEIDTFRYVAAVYSVTALMLILLVILKGEPLFGYSPEIYLLFLAIAFFPQIIGHTSFNWALKYFSATAVSIATLGEPIGASVLAFFILGEKLTLIKIYGGLIIIAGVLLALTAEARSVRNSLSS